MKIHFLQKIIYAHLVFIKTEGNAVLAMSHNISYHYQWLL
jgi:hypothetical protein